MQDQADIKFIRRALDLARQGIGLASPNPCVGAVLVDEHGEVIGAGFHTYGGVQHAEILALEQAGGRANGATLYINLEPCSHHGRTGPCADALVKAGIDRLVACMQDPNPAVAGRGFQRLRDAGIDVNIGMFESEARVLNEAFAKYIRTGQPLVTLKSAMSLDGMIARPNAPGRQYITGEQARAHVQELRHSSDAILVGIGTVLADDPLLTDRSGLPRRRPLLRVVLDSHLRLKADSRLVKTAQSDVVVFYSSDDQPQADKLRSRGVCLERLASAEGLLDIPAAINKLGSFQITSLLVEGGSRVNAAFLSSGVADKVFLYYAPKILSDGVPFIANKFKLNKPAALNSVRFHQFGDDFAVEGYLCDPYAVPTT